MVISFWGVILASWFIWLGQVVVCCTSNYMVGFCLFNCMFLIDSRVYIVILCTNYHRLPPFCLNIFLHIYDIRIGTAKSHSMPSLATFTLSLLRRKWPTARYISWNAPSNSKVYNSMYRRKTALYKWLLWIPHYRLLFLSPARLKVGGGYSVGHCLLRRRRRTHLCS